MYSSGLRTSQEYVRIDVYLMNIGSRMVFVNADWISNTSRVFTHGDVNKHWPDLKCYKSLTSHLVKHAVCQIVAR